MNLYLGINYQPIEITRFLIERSEQAHRHFAFLDFKFELPLANLIHTVLRCFALIRLELQLFDVAC
jgi:hypothetical protein